MGIVPIYQQSCWLLVTIVTLAKMLTECQVVLAPPRTNSSIATLSSWVYAKSSRSIEGGPSSRTQPAALPFGNLGCSPAYSPLKLGIRRTTSLFLVGRLLPCWRRLRTGNAYTPIPIRQCLLARSGILYQNLGVHMDRSKWCTHGLAKQATTMGGFNRTSLYYGGAYVCLYIAYHHKALAIWNHRTWSGAHISYKDVKAGDDEIYPRNPLNKVWIRTG